MKQHGQTVLEGCLLLALTALLFCFPSQSAEAARKGVTLCLELIVPALFPFFVLSSLFITTGLAGLCARPLGKLMSPLFGVGGTGASALLLGLVGGYPVGARTLAQLTERGECSPAEARRLSLFCNNCGPAFFLGAVGSGIFGSREAGVLLLLANLLSALALGMGLHLALDSKDCKGDLPYKTVPRSPLVQELPDCVRSAFSSTLGVCAYVILFSVLTALADCAGLLPGQERSPLVRALVIGFLEVSTGAASLGEAVSSPAALPLAAFILGWGGLSVHCQTLPFWQKAGVPVGPYLLAKLAQGGLAALLTALGEALFPLSLPVMAPADLFGPPSLLRQELVALWVLSGVYFLLTQKKGVEKRRKKGYNEGK